MILSCRGKIFIMKMLRQSRRRILQKTDGILLVKKTKISVFHVTHVEVFSNQILLNIERYVWNKNLGHIYCRNDVFISYSTFSLLENYIIDLKSKNLSQSNLSQIHLLKKLLQTVSRSSRGTNLKIPLQTHTHSLKKLKN